MYLKKYFREEKKGEGEREREIFFCSTYSCDWLIPECVLTRD